ncbi:membrane bound O-acyl transferase family-domain-containing protein [Podospora aff. communis PSN243]|uniref:Membrane bound O-acyl transferase family-domain-containing protein n=1 Tax=Podospora aff. communis PSN243 TaxID=3040156 RepID=A0AAV9G037_9PEZI|nr:membrane bound O-acyl transferase family-domain-containing protein [Podospora aff. communis PSN243]
MSHTPSPSWTPSTALRPCVSISGVIAYSLYTLSSPHRYRLKHVAVIFLLSADYFQHLHDLYPDDHANQAFAHGVLIHLLHMVHIVVLRRDDGYIGTTSIQPRHSSDDYHRAYKMVFNFRGIGTSWEAISTQHSPFPAQQQTGNGPIKLDTDQPVSPGQQDKNAHQALPRRWDDLLRRLFSVICRYLTLSIYYEITEPQTHIWSQALLLSRAYPFSNLLSTTEMPARAYFTLNFIFHEWLLLSTFHECLSIIYIYILRLDHPHEWPPLFGVIFAAYTVRGFWADYWHRLVYAPFRAVAEVISTQVWGKREKKKERSVARRLVNNMLVFFLSGLLHSVVDWKRGLCNPWASGVFYALQPVGFVMESLVQCYAWGPVRKRFMLLAGGTSNAVPTVLAVLETILGYGWVWMWFYCLVPYCVVSELQCNKVRMESR